MHQANMYPEMKQQKNMYVKFQLRAYMTYIVPKPKGYILEWEGEGRYAETLIPGDPVHPLEKGWVPLQQNSEQISNATYIHHAGFSVIQKTKETTR